MPLHPLFVHFPIALLSLATVISIIHLFSKKPRYTVTLTVLLVTGVAFGGISYLLGDSAIPYAMRHFGAQRVEKLVDLHEAFAFLALMFYGLATVSHLVGIWFEKYHRLSGFVTVLCSVIGFVLLIITGHLGASLTYGQ